MQARSITKFPSLAPPSCEFHGREGQRCTPMDCEFYRVAPRRVPEAPVLSQNRVPVKRKGKRR